MRLPAPQLPPPLQTSWLAMPWGVGAALPARPLAMREQQSVTPEQTLPATWRVPRGLGGAGEQTRLALGKAAAGQMAMATANALQEAPLFSFLLQGEGDRAAHPLLARFRVQISAHPRREPGDPVGCTHPPLRKAAKRLSLCHNGICRAQPRAGDSSLAHALVPREVRARRCPTRTNARARHTRAGEMSRRAARCDLLTLPRSKRGSCSFLLP